MEQWCGVSGGRKEPKRGSTSLKRPRILWVVPRNETIQVCLCKCTVHRNVREHTLPTRKAKLAHLGGWSIPPAKSCVCILDCGDDKSALLQNLHLASSVWCHYCCHGQHLPLIRQHLMSSATWMLSMPHVTISFDSQNILMFVLIWKFRDFKLPKLLLLLCEWQRSAHLDLPLSTFPFIISSQREPKAVPLSPMPWFTSVICVTWNAIGSQQMPHRSHLCYKEQRFRIFWLSWSPLNVTILDSPFGPQFPQVWIRKSYLAYMAIVDFIKPDQ